MPSTPPIVMNWQERARRAEELADAMSSAACVLLSCGPGNEREAARMKVLEAVNRWTAHRADLDTLAQAPAQQVGA